MEWRKEEEFFRKMNGGVFKSVCMLYICYIYKTIEGMSVWEVVMGRDVKNAWMNE